MIRIQCLSGTYTVPWDLFEVKYVGLFQSDTGNVAMSLRTALGALIIQSRFQFYNRELWNRLRKILTS